jgi:predicted DsbA family dithiol-disulfide isomerase
VEPLVVHVHYDFASALCYVAHRATARIAGFLREVEIELRWTPLELARITGWRPGDEVAPARRANALRVARELGVALRLPAVWTDAAEANAAAIRLEGGPHAETWRERVFSALFEEGRDVGAPGATAALAGELGIALGGEDALGDARAELRRRTERAAAAEVTGVPTFMLGRWPLGGIQDDDTMRRLLGRFAERARAGALA